MMQGWIVEAPDPHGMVPTSTPYMYNVFETIHMLWMSRWIHNHDTTTILVGAEVRELDNFLGHSGAINDARVDC